MHDRSDSNEPVHRIIVWAEVLQKWPKLAPPWCQGRRGSAASVSQRPAALSHSPQLAPQICLMPTPLPRAHSAASCATRCLMPTLPRPAGNFKLEPHPDIPRVSADKPLLVIVLDGGCWMHCRCCGCCGCRAPGAALPGWTHRSQGQAAVGAGHWRRPPKQATIPNGDAPLPPRPMQAWERASERLDGAAHSCCSLLGIAAAPWKAQWSMPAAARCPALSGRRLPIFPHPSTVPARTTA